MISLLPLMLLAQSPEQLRANFSQQGTVAVAGRTGEWARLPLPEEVLRQVDRDLADVRLVDNAGVLVPFVVQRERPIEPERQVRLVQVSATRKETPAGAGTPNLFEEIAIFALPTERARTPRLELTSTSSRFVRRARFEALTDAGAVVGQLETTIFRIPHAEQLVVWMPALERNATKVRLTLTGQDDGFVSPVAMATFAERAPPETRLAWPISAETSVPRTDGKATVWQLDRPRGFVPMRLSVKTSTPWFDRQVLVKSSNGTLLVEGRVFRQNGATPIERLEVPIDGISDERIEVRIENEDSPPLEKLELAFIIEQPELVFAVPSSLPVSLYFGGHRTHRARFDTSNNEVRLPVELEASTVRDLKPNPDYVPSSPLAAFRKPGAPVTLSEFSRQAWVRGVSAEEVSLITFTAEHAQTMTGDFRDLRLVDAQGNQWPWVLRDANATLPLSLTPVKEPVAGHSSWTFTMAGRVNQLTLVPAATAPYFSRSVTLFFQRPGMKQQQVWSGWLTWNPSESGETSELAMPLDGTSRGEGTYTLEFNDGGDAPITDLGLQATVKVPQLTAVLAAGDYRAVWGSPSQHAPRYDLERVSNVLLELRTTARPAAPSEPNPTFVEPTIVERTGGATRWLFWAVLGLAVLVLGGMTVRIARSES